MSAVAAFKHKHKASRKTRSLPDWARKAVLVCVEKDGEHGSFKKLRQMLLRQRSHALALTILNFAVHQTTACDRSNLLQKLLDIDKFQDDRRNVVNTSYGRYKPIHRAAYHLSDRVFRHLLCAGAVPEKSPQGETLDAILSAGLAQAEVDVGYTLGKIKHFNPSTNFYTVELPNGDTNEYSASVVLTKKYTRQGHIFIPTPTHGNLIFVKDRYRRCKQFLDKRNEAKPAPPRPKKRRMLTKHRAALRIQVWWRQNHGTPAATRSVPVVVPFGVGGALPPLANEANAKALVLDLVRAGKREDFNRFRASANASAYVAFIRQDGDLAALVQEECPVLLS